MNVNSHMTKQGMHYVSFDYQLIPEWAIEFSISHKFSRSHWGQHKSIREAIYSLLKMCAVDRAKQRLSFPSSNLRPNCPKVLQYYYGKYCSYLHDNLKLVTLFVF